MMNWEQKYISIFSQTKNALPTKKDIFSQLKCIAESFFFALTKRNRKGYVPSHLKDKLVGHWSFSGTNISL